MADPIAHPLGNLNVPSPEEYRKRKVALISGMCKKAVLCRSVDRVRVFFLSVLGITGQDGSYLWVFPLHYGEWC